jgi:hypothetical protein
LYLIPAQVQGGHFMPTEQKEAKIPKREELVKTQSPILRVDKAVPKNFPIILVPCNISLLTSHFQKVWVFTKAELKINHRKSSFP